MKLFLDDERFKLEELYNFDVIYAPPSHGNVGQLSIDLIISSLSVQNSSELVKLGWIESNLLIPMIGYESYGCDKNEKSLSICMPMEVYLNKSCKLLIIQQRSPCRLGSVSTFVKDFLSLILSWNSRCLYVLTGAQAIDKSSSLISANSKKLFITHKNSNQIPSSYTNYFSLYDIAGGVDSQKPSSLQGESVFAFSKLVIENSTTATNKGLKNDNYINMKIAKEIIKQYSCTYDNSSNNIYGLVVLGCACEEGDGNIQDAKDLLNGMCNTFLEFKLLSVPRSGYTEPHSWKNLYGNPPAFNCNFY